VRTAPGSLVLDHVEIDLGTRRLISVNEVIAPGEILTIMGESGSGKSTLLAFIGGFLAEGFVARGRAILDGVDLAGMAANRRHVGILFQDPLLFPHMSVGENLLFAIPSQVGGKVERRRLAEEALAQANLEGYLDRDPATLSGGQKARVALMRVLLSAPKALMLDEPFSKLDTALRGRIRSFVLQEATRRQLPVLLVTHDESDARAAGGQVLSLSDTGFDGEPSQSGNKPQW
jgi:putative thiamine transport system ATP-binding protein